jgi:hypothetical protein
MNNQQPSSATPTEVLHSAIQALDLFTQFKAIVASPLTQIQRFIGSLFSSRVHEEQARQKEIIQQYVLKAVDVVKTHYPLIEKLKEGSQDQQHLASYALDVIQRYNVIVEKKKVEGKLWTSWIAPKSDSKKDIEGHIIEPPQTISPAHKTFQALSAILSTAASKKIHPSAGSQQKKATQVMIDAFRLKVTRLVQKEVHFHPFFRKLLHIVKETMIEMTEDEHWIHMQQTVQVIPGLVYIFTGRFKKNPEGKLMNFSVLEDLALEKQVTQTGFPAPLQYTAWGLSAQLAHPYPLRDDQTPLFHALEQRRKESTQLLKEDLLTICEQRYLLKCKKEVLDQNKELFLSLHQRLNVAMLEASGQGSEEAKNGVERFYAHLQTLDAPFEVLAEAHEYLSLHFVEFPLKKLQQAWLDGSIPGLRSGQPGERAQCARSVLEIEARKGENGLSEDNPIQGYILLMGRLLTPACIAILLQYLSEKMNFTPPMLNDFEQKIQACALQQQRFFLDHLGMSEAIVEEDKVSLRHLLQKELEQTIALFQLADFEQFQGPVAEWVSELEVYFNSRFYEAL